MLSEVLAAAERQNLAADPTWLRLLHYERGSDQSVILDDAFFLASNGRNDPSAELAATLRAYFEPEAAADDEQARCRFPARYYWLSSKLDLPGYALRTPGCVKLESWALFDQTTSISLLLVAGYLGNPASTFGHSLLKMNSDAPDDRVGLFDLALNFGALVPEFENPLMYIFRGLTGRYEAGFSDKYFYTQDLVYSRTEFRDMWDYRLNLSKFQRTLMILHVWEIAGKKFKYYFLDKNCGYRVAELVELVLDEEILNHAGRWYVPVELFRRIKEIDQARLNAGDSGLLESVEYIPSSRRKLYHQLKLLTNEEIDIVKQVVDANRDSLNVLIRSFPEVRQTLLLDGLLAYQKYRIFVDRPDSTDVAWQRKDKILLARLQLPPRARAWAPIAELGSPADGFAPANLSVGIAHETHGSEFAVVSWSPFKKESVGQNSLEGNELVFFDISAGFADDSPALFLDRLDFIRILSLNPRRSRIRDESGLSWKLRVGVDKNRLDGDHDYDGVFAFGVGRAWRWGSRVVSFGILNVQAHTDSPRARVVPESGVVLALSRLRARFGLGLMSMNYRGAFEERWGGKFMYRVSTGVSLHLETQHAGTRTTTFGLSRYY